MGREIIYRNLSALRNISAVSTYVYTTLDFKKICTINSLWDAIEMMLRAASSVVHAWLDHVHASTRRREQSLCNPLYVRHQSTCSSAANGQENRNFKTPYPNLTCLHKSNIMLCTTFLPKHYVLTVTNIKEMVASLSCKRRKKWELLLFM